MKAPSAMEVVYMLILLMGVAILLVQWRLLDILKRLGTVARVDAKIDLLLKQAGIEYDPYESVPPDVVEAVQRGKKIEAIKRYRKSTGAGLRQAKDYVEEIERRAGIIT